MGQLRQNPTETLDDVEAGATYVVTRRHRAIGRIVPMANEVDLIPPKKQGRSSLTSLPRHELQTVSTIDELLEDMRGDW